MKKLILLQLLAILFASCGEGFLNEGLDNAELGEVCQYNTDILPPLGFEIDTIGKIDFNGNVQGFQFIDHKIGYALVSNNVGGFVEVFKTVDGGETWSDLEIGIDQFPRNMVFKDENLGIITVHDVTGCPPPNCQDKTVILKTENGGVDWEEIEIQELNGILYHPKFDENGNLYANLSMIDKPTAIMKSQDSGATWDTLYTSAALDFKSVTFSYELYEDKLFVAAKEGKIEVIDTEGNLIKTLETGGSRINDLTVIDDNNIVVALSGEVIKTNNGGTTWETIYDASARIIGFESVEKGLMLLSKSFCPTDVYQANDVLATTGNGGIDWTEAAATTTNLRINFAESQQMGENAWYTIIDNHLISMFELQLK